jgi:high-affinity K+ transport system ATPase subunit B
MNAPTNEVTVNTTSQSPTTTAHGVAVARSLFDGAILRQALVDSFKKFDPRTQVKNPVMFVVLVGSIITLIEAIAHPGIFTWSITIWLFLTVLFANFAEAMAEGGARPRPTPCARCVRRQRPGDCSPTAPRSACRPRR